jgi:hypothetical protein
MAVGSHRATLLSRDGKSDIVDGRGPKADHFDIAGTAERVGAIHVNYGDGLRERVEGILGVISRTEQALLFRCDRKEQHAPLRLLASRQRFHGLGDLE